MRKITLVETPLDFGLTPDYTFLIFKDNVEIGKGGFSDNFDGEDSFLEWIELYPDFQNKSLLRYVLIEICEHFKTDILTFDATEDKVDKYLHLGAIKKEYFDFRGMQRFILHAESLRV